MAAIKTNELAVIPVSKLSADTAASLKQFNCDNKFLNEFAKKQLAKNDKKNLHKGFVAVIEGKVVGYVTTKVASLAKESLAQPGMPNSIPVLSLEQIATDVNYRQRKIGSRLLKEALQVTVHVAQVTGVYGLQLWSHPGALGFYSALGFTTLTKKQVGDIELTLMFMSVETIQQALA